MTVKDQDGKVVYSDTEEYGVYDLHFADNKEGYLGLNNWDITAQNHVNLGLEPHKTESITKVLPLEIGTKSVTVEAAFNYLYEEGHSEVIKKATKKIDY